MDEMEVESGEGGAKQNELNLFSKQTLTEALPLIPRDLSCHTVLQTEEPSWEKLQSILTHHQSTRSNLTKRGDKQLKTIEIFAISWPPHLWKWKKMDVEADVPKVSNLLSVCNKEDEAGKETLLLNLVLFHRKHYKVGQNFAIVELDGVDDAKLAEQFNKLCKIGECSTIHWFSAFQHGFVWRKTYGHIMQTVSATCSSIGYSELAWLRNLNEVQMNGISSSCIFTKNIICISGVAGSGKAALLTRTAQRLGKLFKNRRIYFIDLNLFSSQMIEMELNKTSKPLNFDLFLQLIFEYFEINSDLEKDGIAKLLSSTRGNVNNPPKVELFGQGLDKMNKEMCKVLLKFLQMGIGSSEQWNFRIWITTRPHLKQKVEDMLSVVAFNLKSLCPTDIFAYLQSYEATDDSDHGRIEEIVSSRLEDHLKLDLKRVISTPTRLIEFQSFQKGNQLYDLNGMEIMKEMIKNAKEKYKQTKCKQDPDHLLRKHVPLACKTVFQQILLSTVGESSESQRDHLRLENANFQVEYELLDFGLVEKNDKGELYFVNDTFATFILADYYTSHLPNSDLLLNFFLRFLFFRDECEQVRVFYAQRLHEGVNIAVNDAWSEHLISFIINTYRLSEDNPHWATDFGNVLQLMIIDQKLAIAKMILREFLPSHALELKNLIQLKVKVELNSLRVGCSSATNHIELSALMLAIIFGDAELLHLMYSCVGEVDPNIEEEFRCMDTCRFTPVHLAVIGCNLDTLNYLRRSKHMTLNTLDVFGHLPLHLAFYNGWDMKFCFLEPPSTSPASPSSSPRALLAALPPPQYIYRYVKIIKYYNDLGEGAQLTNGSTVGPDRIGKLPLIASKLEMTDEHREFVQMQMKKKINFYLKPRENPSEMMYYNNISRYKIIIQLLTRRTIINFHDKVEGIFALIEPPFHLACAAGYLPLVKSMVRRNVRINIRGKKNSTALLVSILHGNVHIVKYLLGLQKIDMRDLDRHINSTPLLLHQISSMNLTKMVEFFVKDLGQSVDMSDDRGLTPLHVVSLVYSDRCLETAKKLLEMGATVDATDKKMLTPLMHACQIPEGNYETIIPSFKLIDLLIENGADLNAQNRIGESSLHFAATWNPDLVKHLLLTCEGEKRKIKVNIKTELLGTDGMRAGSTPLHFACRKGGNLDTLKHLMAAGATVNALDKANQIPIQLLINVEAEEMDEEMVTFLVRNGAWLLHTQGGKLVLEVLASKKPDFSDVMFRESNKALLSGKNQVSKHSQETGNELNS